MRDRALVPEICGAQSCIVVHTNQLFFRGLKRLPDPGQELVVTSVSTLKHPHNEFVSRRCCDRQLPPVQAQEGIRHKESDPFISVNKRVIQE